MNDQYKLEVQPGLVEKRIYRIESVELSQAIPPAVNGRFEAAYDARVEVPMGTERVRITSKNDKMRVKYNLKGNNPVKRAANLAVLLWKIGTSEMGAIFSNTKKSVVTYTGLPEQAFDEVKNAQEQYSRAIDSYVRARLIPADRVLSTKKEILSVSPQGSQRISLETIDDTL